jgi:hypothetical protein
MASYSLHIKGLASGDGTISANLLASLLQDLQQAAQRSVRLLMDGSSVKHGPAPAWLEESTDFLVTGIGKGSTKLDVQARTLGETASEYLQQPDMWREIPDVSDTALSVLALCVQDAVANNMDSDRFDRGVLDSISKFGGMFKSFESLEIIRLDRPERVSLSLTKKTVETVQSLKGRTPEPQPMVVSGKLEEIGHKTGQFKLEVSQGNSLRGRVHPEFLSAEALREFWGCKVSIKGMVHFKASGVARFMDAEMLKVMEVGEELFERLPVAVQMEAPFEGIVKAGKERVNVAEFWGQWPGDESIDELLAAL